MDVASPPLSRTDGQSSRGCAGADAFDWVAATQFFGADGRGTDARRRDGLRRRGVDARAADRPSAPGEGAPP